MIKKIINSNWLLNGLLIVSIGYVAYRTFIPEPGYYVKYPVVGVWQNANVIYKFKKDNTGYYKDKTIKAKFTYYVDDENLSINFLDTTVPDLYTYSVEKDRLVLKDIMGKEFVYKRKD